MAEADTEQLVVDNKKSSVGSSFGLIFALIFCFGFGVALAYAAGANWNKECDQPLKAFLAGFGGTGIFAALVFLVLELTSKGDEEDLSGVSAVAFYFVLVLFFVFGIAGASVYWASEDCEIVAAVAHRWTFAGVLAFLILAFLISSSLFGKFGGPVFAVFGMGFANLFQFLANMFKGLSDALTDDGDPANKPAKRSAGGDFSLYVNHAILMWFFGYILMQVHTERDEPCDVPLKKCLLAFGIYGVLMAYFDFLFEKFAGVKTREKLSPYFRYVWAINVLAYIIWGIYTAVEVFSSSSCEKTAKNTYRLSFLLSCVFFVFGGFMGLGLCAGVLDFLCSGRLRFVVVVETGPNEEDEEFKAS
eukprot:c296_g1_i1.p1 GENE.c296_g1_i1~~c296_g1_i1.p1  ORF type:complete len:376 (-),score=97.69 c296_g1_i1:106-1185(-)